MTATEWLMLYTGFIGGALFILYVQILLKVLS